MRMKVKYMGTAAAEGFPAVYCSCETCRRARKMGGKNLRARAQALLDNNLLVDMGPDTCASAARFGLNLMQVEHVLITHAHSDHLYAEDLVFRCEPYGHGGKNAPLTIYGNAAVGDTLERARSRYDDTGAFAQFVHFRQVHPFETFYAGDYCVTALPAVHDSQEECLLFDVTAPDGARLLYGNDSALFPSELMDDLAGKRFDVISLDCTMGGGEPCASHMSLAQCIELAQTLRAIGAADSRTQVVITHFSHNGGLLHEELCARAEGLIVAYDGLELRV